MSLQLIYWIGIFSLLELATGNEVLNREKERELERKLAILKEDLEYDEIDETRLESTIVTKQAALRELVRALPDELTAMAAIEEKLEATKRGNDEARGLMRTVMRNMEKLKAQMAIYGKQSRARAELKKELDEQRKRWAELISMEQKQRVMMTKLTGERSREGRKVKALESGIEYEKRSLVTLEKDLGNKRENTEETRKRISKIQKELELARNIEEAARILYEMFHNINSGFIIWKLQRSVYAQLNMDFSSPSRFLCECR